MNYIISHVKLDNKYKSVFLFTHNRNNIWIYKMSLGLILRRKQWHLNLGLHSNTTNYQNPNRPGHPYVHQILRKKVIIISCNQQTVTNVLMYMKVLNKQDKGR